MIGKTISHYRILEKIGEGGMGVVYKAEDTKLKRTLALKFLPPELTREAEAKARFIHEAQAASSLDHPNICTVHDIGEGPEGQLFMVMPCYEGSTLKEIIGSGGITEAIPVAGADGSRPRANGQLAVADAIRIALQVGEGLKAAHAKNIVHRDLKPANIFITRGQVVKILDFGIAKLTGSQTKLTKTGSTMGTVAYMSPEQAMGKEVDRRADIWSLGVILYEMLAGKTPFQGEYMQAVVYSILNEEPKPLARVRNDMPAGLEDIVSKALAKDPKNRYQSIADLLGDLKAVAEGSAAIKAKLKRSRTMRFGMRTVSLSAAAAVLALLLGLDVGGVRTWLFGPGTASVQAIRLAVLPFANLSSDPEQEYFSDGLTQEMIVQLGKLHPNSLSVIARTSVMRYKKSNTPIDQIGRELGVEYVLEGSAQREAGRVRIRVELIRVRGQVQLWADTYEREMSGIMALQSDVAQKVAVVLALKLLPAEQASLANVRTVSPEAYDAYLKGLQHSYKLGPADLGTALQYFELALKKDPGYALAYAGISFVWTCRQQMGFTPPKEAAPKAKSAAQKSLALDDTVAEAHYALANIMAWGDWNWTGAEMEFKRAIELNPNFPDARIYYSHLLSITGRPDDAMAEVKRVLELDPYNSLFHSLAAADFLLVHRYDEAIAQARSAQRTNADDPVAHNILQVCFFMKGMYEEAFAEWKAMWNIPLYGNRDIAEALDRGYAEAGFTGAMRHATEAWAKVVYERGEPWYLALAYVMAEDKERALEWLEKGFELHDANMAYLGFPGFDGLRSDPRFQSLLRRIGLPSGKTK